MIPITQSSLLLVVISFMVRVAGLLVVVIRMPTMRLSLLWLQRTMVSQISLQRSLATEIHTISSTALRERVVLMEKSLLLCRLGMAICLQRLMPIVILTVRSHTISDSMAVGISSLLLSFTTSCLRSQVLTLTERITTTSQDITRTSGIQYVSHSTLQSLSSRRLWVTLRMVSIHTFLLSLV